MHKKRNLMFEKLTYTMTQNGYRLQGSTTLGNNLASSDKFMLVLKELTQYGAPTLTTAVSVS